VTKPPVARTGPAAARPVPVRRKMIPRPGLDNTIQACPLRLCFYKVYEILQMPKAACPDFLRSRDLEATRLFVNSP